MGYFSELDMGETPTPRRLLAPAEVSTGNPTIRTLADVLALADEIEDEDGLSTPDALRAALAMWTALELDIAADVRYLPSGEQLRAHVSIGGPA